MIGRTLGPYTVLAKLGAGEMGEVYRVRDTRLNRDVAIKVPSGAVAHGMKRYSMPGCSFVPKLPRSCRKAQP